VSCTLIASWLYILASFEKLLFLRGYLHGFFFRKKGDGGLYSLFMTDDNDGDNCEFLCKIIFCTIRLWFSFDSFSLFWDGGRLFFIVSVILVGFSSS